MVVAAEYPLDGQVSCGSSQAEDAHMSEFTAISHGSDEF